MTAAVGGSRAGSPAAPLAATDPAPATPPARAVALNAPVRSLKMLELQISAGADEIYLALCPPAGNAVSFDALPVHRDGEPTQVGSAALLGELITAAHAAGLRVHFCADAPMIPASCTQAYLDHVTTGVEAGADTVVVGSLPACNWLADGCLATDLVAGPTMGVSTVAFATWLRDTCQVRRIVLPHIVTLAEVEVFCRLDGLEIEVLVQTGSGLDCSRCRLSDLPGIGLGCRAGWAGRHGGPDGADLAGADLGGFLDGASDCALCDVHTLIDIGVRALQIPGRESPNLRQNAKVTQLYRRAVQGHAAGTPMPQVVEAIDRVELMWQMGWVPRLCEQQRCRFRDTPQQRAYV